MRGLKGAIQDRVRAYRAALDRMRDLSEGHPELLAARRDLDEAVELVTCLRRLLDGRTADEVHRAFGAPGCFGYDTPIGDALARLYGCIP